MTYNSFIFYSGILFWILIIAYIVLRIVYGPHWLRKLGVSLFLGNDLEYSVKKLSVEIQNKDVKVETLSDLSVSIFKRLTRTRFLGILISIIPIWLLWQQNNLIRSQNKLFDYQNQRINEQTDLFKKQNEKIDLQNIYFSRQTDLFQNQVGQIDQQNELVRDQNQLVKVQTEKLQQQTILSESTRRSSLIFLMSNILDKLDEELKSSDNKEISKELVARIIALSNSFRPYYYFEENKIIDKKLSPERGQLFLALVKSGIDSDFLFNNILIESNFSYADLRGANLIGLNLTGVKLNFADFSEANLSNSSFLGTNLTKCNFKNAILRKTNFNNSILIGSNFDGTDLRGANFKDSFIDIKDFKNSITDDNTKFKKND